MLTRIEEERVVTKVMQRLAAMLQESITGENPEEPEYLTPLVVQRRFSIEQATVRSWVRKGLVEGIAGRPFLVKTTSLKRYLNEK